VRSGAGRKVQSRSGDGHGVSPHLTRYRNLLIALEAHGTFLAVRVVEYDGHASFGDASLTTLVDEVLLVLRAHLNGRKKHASNVSGRYRMFYIKNRARA
jgi:hypothetical protein